MYIFFWMLWFSTFFWVISTSPRGARPVLSSYVAGRGNWKTTKKTSQSDNEKKTLGRGLPQKYPMFDRCFCFLFAHSFCFGTRRVAGDGLPSILTLALINNKLNSWKELKTWEVGLNGPWNCPPLKYDREKSWTVPDSSFEKHLQIDD